MNTNFKKIFIKVLFIFFVFSFFGVFVGSVHGEDKTGWRWWYVMKNPTATAPSPQYIAVGGSNGGGWINKEDCVEDSKNLKQPFVLFGACDQYDKDGPNLTIINSGPVNDYVDKWYYIKSDGKRSIEYKNKEDCKKSQEKEDGAMSDCYALYRTLAPLPLGENGELLKEFDPVATSFVDYLVGFFKLIVGIATVLAVVMIVVGGIQYMTSDLPFAKGEAKNRIVGAVFGLVLALVSWLILYTLNPDILKGTFNIGLVKGTLSTGGGAGIAGQQITLNGKTLTACDESEIVEATLFAQTIRVNKEVKSKVDAVNIAWNALPKTTTAYQYGSGAKIEESYNCRETTDKPGEASSHSFGLSVDINDIENPYSNSNPPVCTTDMPPGFVKLFTDNGWGWGGYFNNSKDPMHFSLKPSEAKFKTGVCKS